MRKPDSRSVLAPEAVQEPQATLAGLLPREGLFDPANLVGLPIRDAQRRQIGRVTHVVPDDPALLSFRGVLEGPASHEVRALLRDLRGLSLPRPLRLDGPEDRAIPERE